jgi:hypothetical protein
MSPTPRPTLSPTRSPTLTPTLSPTPLISYRCPPYVATNTNSDTQNFVSCSYTLGQAYYSATVTASVCPSSFSGDTYLRAYINGNQLASNDDSCGVGSSVTFNMTVGSTVIIAEGCFGSYSCNGTVVLTFTNLVLAIGTPTVQPTAVAPTNIAPPTNNTQFPLNFICSGMPQQVTIPPLVASIRVDSYGAEV